MTYLRPHNYARTKRNRLIATVAIGVVVIIGLTQFFAPYFFPTFFTALARPFWREEFALEIGAFRPTSNIIAENESLKMEIADLRMNYSSSSVAILESRYNDLLSMFGRASTSPTQYKLGSVLARPGALPYDELIIDIGQVDGIASTSKVYAAEKVLIGHVKELLAHSAKVILYSSPRETYDVLIGAKQIPARSIGRGGGGYTAEVPHGSLVQVGDIVTDGTLYGRAFGVVVSVLTDPSNPFDTVLFAVPVNIYQIRFVLVDLPKSNIRR
ncbi:MAG: hypothetical protein NT077_02015 [Candidatus Taylorbacteria bacterium]|nr:hypothetical protein [Candidatus Taylorbacteria bacterium]